MSESNQVTNPLSICVCLDVFTNACKEWLNSRTIQAVLGKQLISPIFITPNLTADEASKIKCRALAAMSFLDHMSFEYIWLAGIVSKCTQWEPEVNNYTEQNTTDL